MRKAIAVLVAATGLAGCAAPPQALSTPSGRPEVVIRGVPRQAVVNALMGNFLEKGASIRSATDHQLVVGKLITDSPAASLFFGSRYDYTPELRVTYNFVDQSDALRVFARAEIVTNPGTGLERLTDITTGRASSLQGHLEDLRDQLERRDPAATKTND